jgi:hypothetical protein
MPTRPLARTAAPAIPADVPEAGDHARGGAQLRDHPRDLDGDRLGQPATEDLLPVDQHEGGQERDGHEMATTQIVADRSSDAAVRNGCIRTTPIPINPLGWSWERVEGYGFLVLGLAWLELGRRGLVGPCRTSEALGSLALLTGPEVLDAGRAGPGDWGLWLGLGLAVGLIVAGARCGATCRSGSGPWAWWCSGPARRPALA